MDVVIPWRRDTTWHAIDANHEAYRIAIDQSGGIRWVHLGIGTRPTIPNGAVELGRLTKRIRIPTAAGVRRGLGATIEHTFLTQSAVDALGAMLEHAGIHDDRLIGMVPNDIEPDAGVVRFSGDVLEIEDLLGFQARDVARRRQSLTLQREAAP